MKSARGATYVDYMVVLSALMAAALGASVVFSLAIGEGASCLARSIIYGTSSCRGTAQLASTSGAGATYPGAQSPMTGDRRAAGEMTCDRLGCRGEGGASCFAPGTPVKTELGPRRIEEIEVGDRVWSRDPESGEEALRRVARVIRREAQPVALVELASARGHEAIRVTFEHPFFVAGRGWTVAGNLTPDDVIEAAGHGTAVVRAVASSAEPATVHNLEVEQFHTYFVGGSSALVHNDCGVLGGKRTPTPPALDLAKGWDAMTGQIRALWAEMAVIDGKGVKPFEPNTTIHDFTEGGGWIRTDFYGVEVTLPPGLTPEALLLHMQQDPHAATGNDATFHGWVTWDRPPATVRKPGDVVNLQILGEPGAIVYVSTVDGKPGGPLSFTVATAKNEESGWHPVSGYRSWGISPLPPVEGKPQRYVIWTAGIDSPSVAGSGIIGVPSQTGTWRSYIAGIGREIRRRGGTASDSTVSVTVTQPNDVTPKNTATLRAASALVKDVLDPKPNPLAKDQDPRYSTSWAGLYHEAKEKAQVEARQRVTVQTLTDAKEKLSIDIRPKAAWKHPITGAPSGYRRYEVRVRYDGDLWVREEANVGMPDETHEWLLLESDDGKVWTHRTPLSPYYVELTPTGNNAWQLRVSKSGWWSWVTTKGTSTSRDTWLNTRSRAAGDKK
ncbi:MAG: Hint domain-containing protein [Deltaproteobacteria bacterium]|nr:Hint domain-containing protein [Deltaproteobacteria bacterium]